MINWLKKNWVLLIFIIIVAGWIKNSSSSKSVQLALPSTGGGMANTMEDSVSSRNVAPTDSTNRLVIQDTSLSLQVKDVPTQITAIESLTTNLGGFLVNSYLSKPESAASGNITVRIPEEKRSEALKAFKELAVKVVSESVSGRDVTDQYVDLESRLAVLLKTKTKFEDILNQASRISDLLEVQRELINLQSQIDSIKGQQKYYEQSAKLSKITIYLSTDELALPYAPTNEWRPTVVFKEAVRSLITNLRNIGSFLIWIFVYIPIIIPILLIILWYKRRHSA
jgi:hypothetical protein